ncbi:MAG: MBL fold metallo-hydrolase [Pseudohongiellaceae bacterium]
MKAPLITPVNLLISAMTVLLSGSLQGAERTADEIADIYRTAAALAAGTEHESLRGVVCPASPRIPPEPATGNNATGQARTIPPLADWYREPARVFDELYFVGTDDHSSWAIVSDEGIILLDTLYDYATGDAIVGGLQKLGLDPGDIEVVIISHGHGDHHGGAKYLQDEFGARIVMGAADWDTVAQDQRNPIPRRDIEATDGMRFDLGNASITLYHTPGHTDGTMSSIVTVHDNGEEHTVAYWGGTSIRPTTPTDNVKLYIDSAVRFRNIARQANADVLLANHLIFDGSREKLPVLAARGAGDPHPYVVGFDVISRYLTVAENCARAEMAYR